MSNIKLVHSGGNSVSLTTPTNNPAANRTFKLPGADGTSGQAMVTDGNGALSFATISASPLGIQMFDSWYLTADKTSNGDITSDLSRVALSGAAAQIGSGMTESSGIFTFPNIGKYLIIFTGAFNVAGNDTAGLRVDVTVDDNTYNQVSQVNGGQSHYSGGTQNSTSTATGFYFLDVTDTSNVKVKFETSSIGSNSALKGSSTYVRTGFIFARIGDT